MAFPMDIRFDKNAADNSWEPHPYEASHDIIKQQKSGFLKRAALPLRWQKFDRKKPLSIFDTSLNNLLSDIEYYASFEDEVFILIEMIYAGFPDPPPWRLISKLKTAENWDNWGYFSELPPAWIFQDRRFS